MSSPIFENISNFRDVAASINNFSQQNVLKPGLFFRGAAPDEATSTDRDLLRDTFGIKTIIDLRTTTEHINAAKKHAAAAALAQSAILPSPDVLVVEPIKIPGMRYAEINLNGKGFERALLWQLTWLNIARVIAYMIFGYRMEAVSIIARNVLQPRGLIGLGIDTLEHSGPEIKQFFNVLADRDSWPVLVHCTQGKDRTGITVLLVLLLCGVSTDSITSDYVKSEAELSLEKDKRQKEVSSIGLDESFSKCPPDFPQRIQDFLHERYGTVQDYLHHIGVDDEGLRRVKEILQDSDEH